MAMVMEVFTSAWAAKCHERGYILMLSKLASWLCLLKLLRTWHSHNKCYSWHKWCQGNCLSSPHLTHKLKAREAESDISTSTFTFFFPLEICYTVPYPRPKNFLVGPITLNTDHTPKFFVDCQYVKIPQGLEGERECKMSLLASIQSRSRAI